MKHLDPEKLFTYAAGVVLAGVLAVVLHKIPRNRGRHWYAHALFVVVCGIVLLVVPDSIQHEIFSPGGVIVLGTLIPIYESIVAVCTIGELDDRAWLQYWIAAASLSFATEFMDEIAQYLPGAGEHWYEFEFMFHLWLLLPLTDGASLLYDWITEPYVAPLARRLKKKCEGYIGIFLALVNTSYIYFVWWAFLFLPEDARRFLVIGLGTVYPIAASIVAISTNNGKGASSLHDDTMWLTYWCSFSILFLAMDYLENFVGSIRGFYSVCAMAVLYLFLPMFQGANVVFRCVLVPLSGQYENMLLHDAYAVKAGMEESIAKQHHERVFRKAAELFSKDLKTS